MHYAEKHSEEMMANRSHRTTHDLADSGRIAATHSFGMAGYYPTRQNAKRRRKGLSQTIGDDFW